MRIVTCAIAAVLSLLLVSPLQARDQEAKPETNAKAATQINLNTATVEQLESLPGIGRNTAERIIEHRQKVGGFKKIEELMNVKGIGEKNFLKLKPMIVVSAKPDKPTSEQQR